MMQLYPESVWSFWQLVGMILTVPFTLYCIRYSRKKWDSSEAINNDTIRIKNVIPKLMILVVPLLVGETLAVIACLMTFPEVSESILYRGFRFYLVTLGCLVLLFSGISLSNRRKKKEREVLTHQVEEQE